MSSTTPATARRMLPSTRRGQVLLGTGVLAGAGALAVGGFLALTSTVSLTVDGQTSTVYTTADTVGELLEREDLEASARDLVVPGEDSTITDGSEVAVAFARPIDLTVDGEQQQVWTTALSVEELLNELGVRSGAQTSVSRSAGIERDGLSLDVRTVKDITVVTVAQQRTEAPVSTTAITVEEALRDAGITLTEGAQVDPAVTEGIADGSVITVNQVWTDTTTQTVAVPFQTTNVGDAALYSDQTVVDVAGAQGQAVETVEITYVGATETGRAVTATQTTVEPTTKVVRTGTKQRPAAPAVANGGVWDSLAQCESGGNWSINTGNSFYGGLQFTSSTWLAYGGGQYASSAHLASREQQIAIAEKVRAARGGYGDWPACSAKLGLPR